MTTNELAERWQCSRTSVHRIAQEGGLTRVCLGNGRNAMVRYIRKEVIDYEKSRQVRPAR